jgi:hypothetical protein
VTGSPTVHTFATSQEAYDASQTRDEIRDGDVLSVPSEQVVGVLVEAWPVAITAQRGSFHRLADGVAWENFEQGRYCESVHVAYEQSERREQ